MMKNYPARELQSLDTELHLTEVEEDEEARESASGNMTGLSTETVNASLGALLVGGPLRIALGLPGEEDGNAAGDVGYALNGLGIPKEFGKIYEENIRSWGILLTVYCTNDAVNMIESCFTHFGAMVIKTFSADKLKESENSKQFDREQNSISHYYHRQSFAKGGKSSASLRHASHAKRRNT